MTTVLIQPQFCFFLFSLLLCEVDIFLVILFRNCAAASLLKTQPGQFIRLSVPFIWWWTSTQHVGSHVHKHIYCNQVLPHRLMAEMQMMAEKRSVGNFRNDDNHIKCVIFKERKRDETKPPHLKWQPNGPQNEDEHEQTGRSFFSLDKLGLCVCSNLILLSSIPMALVARMPAQQQQILIAIVQYAILRKNKGCIYGYIWQQTKWHDQNDLIIIFLMIIILLILLLPWLWLWLVDEGVHQPQLNRTSIMCDRTENAMLIVSKHI